MDRKAKYKPQEKVSKFVLRLPDTYDSALKGLVEKGAAKSKNELIVEVIALFLSDLRAKAEKELSSLNTHNRKEN